MNSARPPFISYLGWILFVIYLLLAISSKALEFIVGSMNWGPPGTASPLVESLLSSVVFLSIWAFGGALLIYRQPKNPFGWIFSAVALLFAVDDFAFGYAYYGTITQPDALPGVAFAIIWLYWSGRAVGAFGITLLFGLFPTGRPLTPRWGKFLWFNGGVAILYIVAAAISPLPIINTPFAKDMVGVGGILRTISGILVWIFYVLLIVGAIIATASLVIRFRRSKGVERLQLKWFVFAAVFFIPGIVFIILGTLGDFTGANIIFSVGVALILIVLAGIPIASAIAILRYNLFDIDIIIRRTLVYSLLTGLLALIYFGVVIFLQTVLGAVTGQRDSPVITVISTLIIASLFQPLRQRVQAFIDRRFFRRKYDAQQVLAEFAQTARDETDMEKLTAELLQVVTETMQPKEINLWLNR